MRRDDGSDIDIAFHEAPARRQAATFSAASGAPMMLSSHRCGQVGDLLAGQCTLPQQCIGDDLDLMARCRDQTIGVNVDLCDIARKLKVMRPVGAANAGVKSLDARSPCHGQAAHPRRGAADRLLAGIDQKEVGRLRLAARPRRTSRSCLYCGDERLGLDELSGKRRICAIGRYRIIDRDQCRLRP